MKLPEKLRELLQPASYIYTLDNVIFTMIGFALGWLIGWKYF